MVDTLGTLRQEDLDSKASSTMNSIPSQDFFFLPNLYCIIFQNTPKLERAVMNSAIPSA